MIFVRDYPVDISDSEQPAMLSCNVIYHNYRARGMNRVGIPSENQATKSALIIKRMYDADTA